MVDEIKVEEKEKVTKKKKTTTAKAKVTKAKTTKTKAKTKAKAKGKGLLKNSERKAYDKEYEISKLKLIFIVVNRNQGDYFIHQLINNFNVAAVFLANAYGTATRDIYEVLGVGEIKKDLVVALVKEEIIDDVFEMIHNRFSISNNSKGIACTVKVNSLISVLLYRFLTDTKQNVKRKE